MHGFNLKRRIFAPLILSGLVIFFIGLYLVTHHQRKQIDDTVYKQAVSLRSHIQSIIDVRVSSMAASLGFIVHDEAIVAALGEKDRDTLLKLSAAIYQRLNRTNNITHLYFHEPDRRVLLRAHQPARHGDRIDRVTLLTSEKTSTLASGIELGALGTFTLRCILPVFDREQLIGYVELGQEIDDILHQTRQMFAVDTFMLIDKQTLDRKSWESGMTMLRRPFNWEQFPNAVLVSKSMPQEPDELLREAGKISPSLNIVIKGDIALAGHRYWSAIIPIPDAADRPIANLVMLTDMTATTTQSKKELLRFIAIVSVIALAVLVIFFVVLNRTEKQLLTLEQKRQSEYRTRHQMQANYIRRLQAEHAKLIETEERVRLLLVSVGEGIFGLDLNGQFTFINPVACRMLGYSYDELSDQSAHQRIHHKHADGSHYFPEKCPISLTLSDGKQHRSEDDIFWRKDGTYFPSEYTCTPVLKEGTISGAVVVFSDITLRKQAQIQIEQALHIQRVLDTILNIALPPLSLKEVLSRSLDAVLSIPVFSLLNQGSIFLVSDEKNMLKMVAHRNLPDSLLQSCENIAIGHCLCGQAALRRELIFKDRLDHEHESHFPDMTEHGHYCLPIQTGEKLLGVLNIYVSAGHVSDESERNYLKTVADTMALVIERKKSEEILVKLAHHDILTGLPNRTLFQHSLIQAIALAQRRKECFFLLFLDLDHFKEINDDYGHDVGDHALKEASRRLQACARKSDIVCRMGGDEFTVLLSQTMQPEHAAAIAQRIIDTFSQPFVLGDTSHRLGCSIGIADYPGNADDGETLVKRADQAMYQAKIKRNSYCFYRAESPV
ncbi:MAG: diguanylate cyclase domain-containing protein [Gammaproteobacteria bacterium]